MTPARWFSIESFYDTRSWIKSMHAVPWPMGAKPSGLCVVATDDQFSATLISLARNARIDGVAETPERAIQCAVYGWLDGITRPLGATQADVEAAWAFVRRRFTN